MSNFDVKPLLLFGEYRKQEQTSWRPWGGIQTDDDANKEVRRIKTELDALLQEADFPLSFESIVKVRTTDDIKNLDITADSILVYAAGIQENDSIEPLEALLSFEKPILFFLRKDYLWYEILHPRFLRMSQSDYNLQPVLVDDVVVEDYGDLLCRLRALNGLKLTRGARILTIGEPGGWGIEEKAYEIARKTWDFTAVSIPYQELEAHIQTIRKRKEVTELSKEKADTYLSEDEVNLSTKKEFVYNAFLLEQVFRDLMEQHDVSIFTIKDCMTTVIPISETTACLPLSLLNDSGYLAFCESDFVAIPAGILLHYISQKPVFLVDPTYPYNGEVIIAHCTAPRRMDGSNLEKVEILTHYESDYGAAPQVKMKEGQVVTVIDPDFEGKEWLGFRGVIRNNPTLDICRTQIEIDIDGDWRKLLKDMKGFHWLVVYGDYLREIDYALKKVGLEFVNLSNTE